MENRVEGRSKAKKKSGCLGGGRKISPPFLISQRVRIGPCATQARLGRPRGPLAWPTPEGSRGFYLGLPRQLEPSSGPALPRATSSYLGPSSSYLGPARAQLEPSSGPATLARDPTRWGPTSAYPGGARAELDGLSEKEFVQLSFAQTRSEGNKTVQKARLFEG